MGQLPGFTSYLLYNCGWRQNASLCVFAATRDGEGRCELRFKGTFWCALGEGEEWLLPSGGKALAGRQLP
jgi:hypothetical protein